jgi:hypothetical protein
LAPPTGSGRSLLLLSAIRPWGSHARTTTRGTRPMLPTGIATGRPRPCSATSTVAWGDPSGPTSACTSRRSCCCSAPKDCAAAHRWHGRSTGRSVAEVVSPPQELVLYCGMSIGHEATASHARASISPSPTARVGRCSLRSHTRASAPLAHARERFDLLGPVVVEPRRRRLPAVGRAEGREFEPLQPLVTKAQRTRGFFCSRE